MGVYLPAAFLFVVWSFIIYRIGVKAGRDSAARGSLAGAPPMRPPRPPRRELTPEVRAAIEHALANRQKIEAIRILREATGMGLKESKETIEAEWE